MKADSNMRAARASTASAVSTPALLLNARLVRVLLWVLLAAHVLLVLGVLVKTRPWLTGDSPRYLALAEALAEGRGYGLAAAGGSGFEPENLRMPGYPVFIMLTGRLTGLGDGGVVLAQALMFLCAVWLMWRVAKEVFGQAAGLCFLALSACYPFVAYSVGQISPETPAVFLLALMSFMLLRPSVWRLAAAGLALGLAAYFRPNLLLLGVALVPALLLANRRLYARALLPLIVSGTLLLPWAIHNYRTFGVFTPTSIVTGFGINLFLGTWQSRVPVSALIDYGMTGRAPEELERAGMMEQVRAVNRELGLPPNTTCVNMGFYPDNETRLRAEKLYAQVGISNVRAWPGAYARGSLKNMARMWFSAHLPESLPYWVRLALLMEGLLVLLMGVAGALLALWRERGAQQRLMVYAFICTSLYFSVTLCWSHTEARYTIPVRLMLLAFAAYAFKSLFELLRARVWRSERAETLTVGSGEMA